MFFALLFLARSGLIGVDFGGETLRVSYLTPGQPVGILLDPDSHRYFKTTLTVLPNGKGVPPIINSSNVDNCDYSFNSEKDIRKNPNTTIRFYNTLLAKILQPNILQLLLRRMYSPIISLHLNKRLLFSGIFPELVLHKALSTINETARASEPPFIATTMYACVPKFFMQQERSSIRTIARMLNYTPYIIDQSAALSYNFAMTHDRKISKSKKPIKVAFIDIGETNTQLTITQYSGKRNITAKEIYYDYNETIGGRDFDVLLFKMLKKFTTHKITASDEFIMLKEANKIKHRLTTDKFVVGQCECSSTFSYNISKDDFETMMSVYLQHITKLITNSKIQVDIVQLIGGSTRIPCIQECLKKAFNVKDLSTSMIPEEAIAIGAAFYGATKSRDYKVTISVNHSGIDLYKATFINSRGHPTSPNITGETIYVRSTGKRIPYGSSEYAVWGKTDTTSFFMQTSDGIWKLKNRTKKGQHAWKVDLEEMQVLIENRENHKRNIEMATNALENLILDTKSALRDSEKLKLVSTEKELKSLSIAVNLTDRWFLKQKKYQLDTLESRISSMRDAVGNVMCRVQNMERLNLTLENMTRVFHTIENTISKEWSFKSRRPKRDQIRHLIRMMIETKLWVVEKQRLQSRLSMKDNPTFTWYELADRVNFISKEYSDIMESLQFAKVSRKSDDILTKNL